MSDNKNTPVKAKKSTKLFFSGVLILTFANILIKVIGLTLKIPLQHLLGDGGMGYYNTAYDIYVWFYMISTAGLPVAISILISESRAKGNFREAKRIFRITLLIFIILGLAGMFIMMGGAGLFANAYKFPEADKAIFAIAPTLFFICISSAIRGYFQGYQHMVPTALSQIVEALGKLIIGISLAKYAINAGYDLPMVAAFTVLGLTIGVAAGMLFLCISKLLFKAAPFDEEYRHPDSDTMPMRPTGTLLKIILVTAIPITLSSSVMSFTSMIDGMILSDRLQWIGYTEQQAREMFGNYKTLAVSMFNLPPALIYPITYAVVPLLSATIASQNKERARAIINSTLKVSSIIALPCALGLSALSEPILKLLFNDESAKTAAPLLSVLAPTIFLVGMLAVSTAVLQSYKLERKPIISMVAGSVVKLAASFVLIGIPAINIFGAPIGTFLCYLTNCGCNFYFMSKHIDFVPSVKEMFVRPLIASVLCALSALGSYHLFDMFLGNTMSTVGALGIAVIVYAVAILLFKCITKDDLMVVPKGQKIYSILHKTKLI